MMLNNMFSTLTALCTLFFFPTTTQGQQYPLPEPCEGVACANPPGVLDYQDFSVIRRVDDGQYFRFAKSNDTGAGITVATAPTLRGPWTYSYEAMTQLPRSYISNRTDTDVWAPDVKLINNTYYLFYSIHTNDHSVPPQTFDLAVATSPSMEPNSWTDQGPMGVPGVSNPTEYERLDSNLVSTACDPSGASSAPFMAFGSSNWGLYGFPVTADYLKIVEGATPQLLVADQLNPGNYSGNKTEGPFQLENQAYIYLFYSIGNCCPALDLAVANSVYRVEVCRTPAATPGGPYVTKDGTPCAHGGPDEGTVVLASQPDGSVFSPGSIGILDDPDEGGLIMYYQYFNVSAAQTEGLRFGFNYLEFGTDGWPVLVEERST